MAIIDDLQRKIEEQDKQLKTLKQAILRLERLVRSVSVVANRSQGQSQRAQEQINTINTRLKKHG